MYYRLIHTGIGFSRPRRNTLYKMLNHKPSEKNPKRFELLKGCVERMKRDGLKSVQYELLEFIKYQMFTFMSVDVGEQAENLTKIH